MIKEEILLFFKNLKVFLKSVIASTLTLIGVTSKHDHECVKKSQLIFVTMNQLILVETHVIHFVCCSIAQYKKTIENSCVIKSSSQLILCLNEFYDHPSALDLGREDDDVDT